MEAQKNGSIKCYCSVCGVETNHQILSAASEEYDSEYDDYWRSDYYIVKCMGCDQIQFYQEIRDETTWIYEDDCQIDKPNTYTFPRSKKLVKPIDIWVLPLALRSLYSETMDCLNRGNFQLAGAGFRAVIEAICLDNNVNGRDLNTKINNLAKQRIVTEKDKENLHAIRFLGNFSIHCIQRFEEEDLVIVAKIVNAMLTSLYVISGEVEKLTTKPITDFTKFLRILKEGIKEKGIGKVDTLKNLVKHCRLILQESLPDFENELISLIEEGKFPNLSLRPKRSQDAQQQYKIESVD